jgi:hypothetical protein
MRSPRLVRISRSFSPKIGSSDAGADATGAGAVSPVRLQSSQAPEWQVLWLQVRRRAAFQTLCLAPRA